MHMHVLIHEITTSVSVLFELLAKMVDIRAALSELLQVVCSEQDLSKLNVARVRMSAM